MHGHALLRNRELILNYLRVPKVLSSVVVEGLNKKTEY